jgi:hypothetical protein
MAPAVVLTVVVTGCSGGGDSSAPSKLPAAGTAAPSATPTPPPSPSPQAEVEAFVREYYQTINDALLSGRVDRLESLSTPDCSCRRLPAGISAVYSKGRMDGASFTLEQVSVTEVHDYSAQAEVRYSTSTYTEKDLEGQVLRAYEAGPGHNMMSLVKVGGRWELTDAVRMG